MLIYEYQINHMIRSSCLSYEIKKKEFKSRIKERISPCAGECILPLGAIASLAFWNALLLASVLPVTDHSRRLSSSETRDP